MKKYRESEIKWYILAYLFLLIGIGRSELPLESNIEWLFYIEKHFSSVLLAGVICTLAFVFDCLYTATLKEVLLFLGFTKIPGKTIFSRISKGKLYDIRFEIKLAQERYKEIIDNIPTEKKVKGKYENSKWYALSLKHEKNSIVETSHRDFLICRDLYTTTITMLVLTAAGVIIGIIQFHWIPIAYLVVLIVLTNLAARSKAHRFVNSVIAVDINTNV